MTKKEEFIKRFTEKYSDVDMTDEDRYYDQANRLMDDYENYENATKNLIEALDGNAQPSMHTEGFRPCGVDGGTAWTRPEGSDVEPRLCSRHSQSA